MRGVQPVRKVMAPGGRRFDRYRERLLAGPRLDARRSTTASDRGGGLTPARCRQPDRPSTAPAAAPPRRRCRPDSARGAELERIEPAAQHGELVDGLRALIALAVTRRREGFGSAAPLTPSRTFSGRTAIFTASPARTLAGSHAVRRSPPAASTVPNSPLRSSTRPASRLEAPVKLATNRSAGRL